jgi:hypothetical protein
MKAFPVPASISNKVYGIFELLSVDIVPMNKTSIRGFNYIALFVDKATSMPIMVLMKSKTELLAALQYVISHYGPQRNPRCVHLRFMQSDSGSEQLSNEFLSYLDSKDIKLLLGAPYKKQQQLIERYVQSVRDGLRTALAYNNTPYTYWDYASEYYVYTFSRLPRMGHLTSRHEQFYGEVPDVSHMVPFYSDGYHSISSDEREKLQYGKAAAPKARRCRMIGYATDTNIEHKNSYLCLEHGTTNSVTVRHDCYFKHYTDDSPSLLSAEVEQREQSTFSPEEPVNYDELFGKQSEVNDETHSSTTRTEVNDEPHSSTTANTLEPPQRNNHAPLDAGLLSDPIVLPKGDEEIEVDVPPAPTNRTSGRCRKFTERLSFHASTGDYELETVEELTIPIAPTKVPSTLLEAVSSAHGATWRDSWVTEMHRACDRDTFSICSEQDQKDPTKIAIKSKYAFRLTQKPDGSWKYKVRIVACGYSQVYGRDYTETYAPTAAFKSFCTVMQIAAMNDWYIKGIDVENAYLESTLNEDIYMYLPKDVYRFPDGQPVKVKLNKALYGLKQAGELWYKLLRDNLLKAGYVQTLHDRCVYTHYDNETGSHTIVVVYVDDVIITGNHEPTIDALMEALSGAFMKITDLGIVTRYVGIDITRDMVNHSISFTQKPYIESYLRDEGIDVQAAILSSKQNLTPMNPTIDLNVKGDGSIEPIRDRVGKLRFMTDRTHPELLVAVGKLAMAGETPSKNHITGLSQMNHYLANSLEDALTLGGSDKEIRLFGFCDASYIAHGDSMSQLAYCLFLNRTSGTVCARSKKDTTVSHSSAEAEIKAIDLATIQIIWFRGFLDELGFPQHEPTPLYTDSQSAKILAETFHLSHNTAHMVMRINFIHQEVNSGTISLKYINTEQMVADVLTKIQPHEPFGRHKRKLLSGFDNVLPTPALPAAAVKRRKRTLDKKLATSNVTTSSTLPDQR